MCLPLRRAANPFQIGSLKVLDEPSISGNGFKILGAPGYDDGGVADLSLLIDLNDSVTRRRRGETEYFSALKVNSLPRATRGPMARMPRRDQKVSLAQLLFAEDEANDDKGPSEVYSDQSLEDEDPAVVAIRAERLSQARASLRLSMLLCEPACACMSLSEICKRNLLLKGRSAAEESLRCANKAVEIAGDGFWDGDDVSIEVRKFPSEANVTEAERVVWVPASTNLYFYSSINLVMAVERRSPGSSLL